jgi:hypothetical protein
VSVFSIQLFRRNYGEINIFAVLIQEKFAETLANYSPFRPFIPSFRFGYIYVVWANIWFGRGSLDAQWV